MVGDGRDGRAPIPLRLYVTGGMPGGRRALKSLPELMEALADLGFQIEIVDILEKPDEASAAGIVVTPTLSDESVTPPRRMIGDFGDIARIVEFFGRRGRTVRDDLSRWQGAPGRRV